MQLKQMIWDVPDVPHNLDELKN